MPPLTRAKAFVTHTGSLIIFGEFVVLVYYEVVKHALNYDRIDLVFDQYFKKNLKVETRSGKGEGSQYLFQGYSTDIFYKMAVSFLKNNQNNNKMNEYLCFKLLELHQDNRIMIATYRNTSLSSPSSCLELHLQVSVRLCEAEKAGQRLVRHIELD